MLQLIEIAHLNADFLPIQPDDASILVKVCPDPANNIGPKKPNQKSRRKKKSRWKKTVWLTIAEVKELQSKGAYFDKLGYTEQIAVTIQPPFKYITQEARKDFCEGKRLNICKKIKQAGSEVIWIYTYECNEEQNKPLHMHLIFFLRPRQKQLIQKILEMENKPVLEIKKADKNWMKYMTKTRATGSPEYQEYLRKKFGRYEEKSTTRIYGKRFDLSRNAKKILEETGYYKKHDQVVRKGK